jgi:hypothetical protein
MEENNDLQYGKSKEYSKNNEDIMRKIDENCLKDIIYKKFRTVHFNHFSNLLKDFNVIGINGDIERTKILIKIYEYIIENVEEINYVGINYHEKFRSTIICKIPDLMTQCIDHIEKSNENIEDIIIYEQCLNILKKALFEMNHNFKKSKMDLMREDICIKVFHPRFVDRLWTFDE